MRYYYATTVDAGLGEAEARTREALSAEGFGVLTEIDVEATLREKLGVDFRPYKILGACNPRLAHQALVQEPRIGTMLPCNVILQETEAGSTEVACIDPVVSMQGVENETLAPVAEEVRERLRRVIDALS
jgi:uncharacterized protein (DUF302 family)